jgi:hypothetical protein
MFFISRVVEGRECERGGVEHIDRAIGSSLQG